jgi:hypothetical protein
VEPVGVAVDLVLDVLVEPVGVAVALVLDVEVPGGASTSWWSPSASPWTSCSTSRSRARRFAVLGPFGASVVR